MTDVSTRWGLTYAMMERVLEQQQAICAVLSNDRKNWSKMPSDAEFTNIETTVAILNPLSTFYRCIIWGKMGQYICSTTSS